jgi:hypothetical protein
MSLLDEKSDRAREMATVFGDPFGSRTRSSCSEHGHATDEMKKRVKQAFIRRRILIITRRKTQGKTPVRTQRTVLFQGLGG